MENGNQSNNDEPEPSGWSSGMSLAEQVKAIAEEAVVQSGYVYNEETGLYYDSSTGYYYDPKDGLYYNGYTGTYYRYDEETSNYVFHHQIEGFTFEQAVAEQVHSALNTYTSALSEKIKSEVGDVSTAEEEEKQQKRAKLGFSHSLAEGLPPCMRVVVKESSDKEIKVGALFVIPYTGGSIGRNRDCILCLDDVNISKQHAKLYYCKENDNYVIQDLGSRNGTWLNSVRLSETKEVSELYIVGHDSTLRVGGTELLCHVHPGLETCEQCEPGLLKTEPSANVEVTSREDLESQRKKEMKKIREKFGLKYHEESEPLPKVAGYVDRAESRRQTVGVDYVGAKAEVASTKTPIPAKNKGFQLLAKMGWNEGSSLGKTESSSGIIEPISVEVRGREGLGAEGTSTPTVELSAAEKRKVEAWQKTRERYSQL